MKTPEETDEWEQRLLTEALNDHETSWRLPDGECMSLVSEISNPEGGYFWLSDRREGRFKMSFELIEGTRP